MRQSTQRPTCDRTDCYVCAGGLVELDEEGKWNIVPNEEDPARQRAAASRHATAVFQFAQAVLAMVSHALVSGLRRAHFPDLTPGLPFVRPVLQAATSVMPNGQPLQLRVGIHSGPICSGVVGHRMPKYCEWSCCAGTIAASWRLSRQQLRANSSPFASPLCAGLFGDSMNTTSRMETTALPCSIHLSQATYELLAAAGQHSQLESTGGLEIKGKGWMVRACAVPAARLINTALDQRRSPECARLLPAAPQLTWRWVQPAALDLVQSFNSDGNGVLQAIGAAGLSTSSGACSASQQAAQLHTSASGCRDSSAHRLRAIFKAHVSSPSGAFGAAEQHPQAVPLEHRFKLQRAQRALLPGACLVSF